MLKFYHGTFNGQPVVVGPRASSWVRTAQGRKGGLDTERCGDIGGQFIEVLVDHDPALQRAGARVSRGTGVADELRHGHACLADQDLLSLGDGVDECR
ncbi:MAG TPA: hypothetical protein VF469_34455 [Kofleriaceae bacterium]